MPLKIDGADLILEDKNGIQGRVKFDKDSFEIVDINEEYYLDFVMMIEEFLFMKYDTIIFKNPTILPKNWESVGSQATKKKSSNYYNMTVPLRGVSTSLLEDL